MKTLKMGLESIQGKLTRNEMKNVLGGQQQAAVITSGAIMDQFQTSLVLMIRPLWGHGQVSGLVQVGRLDVVMVLEIIYNLFDNASKWEIISLF